ncbi:MAG: HNH endonuclease [Cyanobacteria bacterium P01_D01_bin.36]
MSDYVSAELKAQIRQQARNRYGYCLSLQQYVLGTLEIEYIIPKSAGGSSREDNLWMACRPCNSHKADRTHGIDPLSEETVALYHPRKQTWNDHFAWSNDGTHIVGTTPCGRVTVEILQLNNPFSVAVRRSWVSVGWHPPKSDE